MKSFAVAALALCACGNSAVYTPFIGDQSITLPEGATSLDISGAFFAPGMTVFWNGARQTTHFISSQQASVDLAPGLTTGASRAQVTAQNDGGFPSAAVTVSVSEPFVTLTSASPQQLTLGGPASSITVTGTGFRSTDVVTWNSAPLATTLTGAGTLTATVPASMLAIAGDGFIGVSDPVCNLPGLCTQHVAGLVIQVGTSTRNIVGSGDVADAAWDATDSEFLLLSLANSVVTARTPANELVTSSQIDTAPARVRLVISDDDRFAYLFAAQFTFPQQTTTPLRLSLPGLSGGVTLAAAPGVGGPGTVAPGAGSTVALTGGDGVLVIFDGTTARPKTADATGVLALAWGFDASTLYGIVPFVPGLVRFSVDETGVTGRTSLGSAQFGGENLHYDRTTRRLYGDSGRNFDEQGADPRPFATGGSNFSVFDRTQNCAAAVDASLGKAFFSCEDPVFGTTVQSFDLATQQPIANIRLKVNAQSLSALRIIRFGADGLAVVADRNLYTYQGPFVH